jgi:hypothetical protein
MHLINHIHGESVMRQLTAFLMIASGLVLMACGGGGGDGVATTPAVPAASLATPLTASNYPTYATPTAATISGAKVIDGSTETLKNNSSDKSESTAISASPALLALQMLRELTDVPAGREQAKAINTLSRSCPFGGSFTGTSDDVDNSRSATAGDKISVNLKACALFAGQPAASGNMSYTLISAVEKNNVLTSISADILVSDFSSDGNVFNGALRIAADERSATGIYKNFNVTRRGITTVFNFTVVADVQKRTSTYNGLITVSNNTYTLSTPAPIVFGVYRPVSGTLRIADSNGNRVDIVPNGAASGSVDFNYYASGSTTPIRSSSSTWLSL